ncbi:MAG: 5-methyltetrahydropteroyltriglutamate--homocysteine methyltransferase, partial [Candidatus Binatota bacterium]|nr:5-methyltetrahydropteroyltriglutamate--homocysteine methyltransferase [Candidatus Binatota bacterium]
MARDLPHRAEHVGSLLRPRELKEAFRRYQVAELGAEAFAAIQDRCIRNAIRMQHDVGLETITDGEFRRAAWSAAFVWALDGLSERDSRFEFHDDAGETQRWRTCFATGRIRRARPITLAEFGFVRRHTDRTPKVTMPAPSFLHFFRAGDFAAEGVYADRKAFWSDVVRAYREELEELARAGAPYVQIDEVPLAMLCDETIRERIRSLGEDPDSLVEEYVAAVNHAIDPRPQGLTVGMHLCRGNLRGKWMAAGGYEPIAERVFGGIAVDAFFLEYDSPRAGDFAPLRFVPRETRVVLGLVSTKTPLLEDADTLRRRIDEAARVVPLERLAL